jgi:hypothetical protein
MPGLAQELYEAELRRLKLIAETERRKVEAAEDRFRATVAAPVPPPPPEPKTLGVALLLQYGPSPWTRLPAVATGPAHRDMSQTFALKKPRAR